MQKLQKKCIHAFQGASWDFFLGGGLDSKLWRPQTAFYLKYVIILIQDSHKLLSFIGQSHSLQYVGKIECELLLVKNNCKALGSLCAGTRNCDGDRDRDQSPDQKYKHKCFSSIVYLFGMWGSHCPLCSNRLGPGPGSKSRTSFGQGLGPEPETGRNQKRDGTRTKSGTRTGNGKKA